MVLLLQDEIWIDAGPVKWLEDVKLDYELTVIWVFCDFSNPSLTEEVGKIRCITNKIIETGNSPIVVGLFTEDELTNFKASEKYGYAFHFETNGDGSSASIDEENVVTNFNSVLY